MTMPCAPPSKRRDRIAWRLANLVLNTIATRRYREFIEGAVHYGLSAAIRDEQEGRDLPPSSPLKGSVMAIDPNALASALPAGITYWPGSPRKKWRGQEIAEFQAGRLAESGYLLAYADDETLDRVGKAIFDEIKKYPHDHRITRRRANTYIKCAADDGKPGERS